MRALVIALALLAAPASAQELPFQAVAGQARMLLATSGPLADALDPGSRAVLGAALAGPDGVDTGPLWERLMAGALQIRREHGEAAQTLWFNPLIDAGLLLRWAKDTSGWQIVQASAVTGEALRGEALGDGLGWTQRDERLSVALRHHGLASFRAIEAADWGPLFATDQRAEVLRRAARAEVSVEALQATPGYETARPMLAELLVTGNPSGLKLPAAMVESLNEMGERARLHLGTASAFRLDDGWTMALQSASAPGVTWLITFADGGPALPVAFAAIGMEGE